ncbi:hypothetical protein BJX68DRAFT_273726 [Aspergillus pseudodeflectus]|uniref:Uncharacterized protein n=1 Tax=Aspergillus pseudodeflectus TaxID=176178 RepID=A0ABR4J6J5_9EURO
MPTPTLPTTPRQRHRHGSSSSSSSDYTKGNRDRDADKNVDVDGDAAFKAHTTRLDHAMLAFCMGPVRELLDNRLLAFHIAKSEVPPAQLRWHPDGETLVWSDVIFHLEDLPTIIPALDLTQLVDNWDATTAGHSFLTDSRNAAQVEPAQLWLLNRVLREPALFNTFWAATADRRRWQYQDTVQRFLRVLLIPFFLGAGQSARRTEFVALLPRGWSDAPPLYFFRP